MILFHRPRPLSIIACHQIWRFLLFFFRLKISQDDMRNGNLKIDNAGKFSFSLAFLISFSFLRGFDEAAFKKLGINFD